MSEKPCVEGACGYCNFLEEELRVLKAKIAGGTRVLTMKCTKTRDAYWVSELQKGSDLANATLLLDE